MIVRLLKDKPENTDEKEPEMKLFLFERKEGVSLKAADASGREFYILTFDGSNGIIHRHTHINPKAEWPINREGRLEIAK